jgi:trigger factor
LSSPESEVKNFENENISVNVTVRPGCHVKFECTAKAPFVKQAYQEGLNRVRKEVSIPGFRKGKAPDSILVKNYNKAVDGEWKDALLNAAFNQSIVLSSRSPLKAATRSIKSSIKSVTDTSTDAHLEFEFESVPVAPSIDISLINFNPIDAKAVTDEDVNEKIDQARLSLAQWEDITDRVAAADDFVRLDLEEIKDGQAHQDFTNERFQITPKKMSPWLRELVIGLKVGQSKEGLSQPDEALDLDEESKKQFKPALFKVTLKAIEKPNTPSLDEEFAKRVGVTTVEEVKNAIRKQLERMYLQEKYEKEIKQLEETLTSIYSFDLPYTLVKKDSDTAVKDHLSKLSPEEIESKRVSIEENAKKSAIKHLTLYYLMCQFNDDNKIRVTNDDLNREVSKLLQQFPQEMLPQIAKSLNDEFYTAVLFEVTVRKGLEHLLKKISK